MANEVLSEKAEDNLLAGLGDVDLMGGSGDIQADEASAPTETNTEPSSTEVSEAVPSVEDKPAEVKLNPPAPAAPAVQEVPSKAEVKLDAESLEALKAVRKQEPEQKQPSFEEAKAALQQAAGRPVVTKDIAATLLGIVEPSDDQVAKLQQLLDTTANYSFRLANMQMEAQLKNLRDKEISPIAQGYTSLREQEEVKRLELEVNDFYEKNADLKAYPKIIDYVCTRDLKHIQELAAKGDYNGGKAYVAEQARAAIKEFGIPQLAGEANLSAPKESKSVPKPARTQSGGRSQSTMTKPTSDNILQGLDLG